MSANSRYKTHRGREFNMSAFAEKNGDARAVGNASMNARGDIIDAKGNIKIPSQTISRAAAALKNTDPKQQVSLKTDDTISAVKNTPTVPDSIKPTIVSQRTVETPNGPATEVEFSDGSMEIIPLPETPTSL